MEILQKVGFRGFFLGLPPNIVIPNGANCINTAIWNELCCFKGDVLVQR